MDFSYSEEQTILKDSIQKFIRDDYEFEKRRKSLATNGPLNPAHWKTFADLGWLCLPFAEDDGGIGGSSVDLMILMEEFGKGLVTEPYLETVVMAGGALRRGGTVEQKARWIPGIIEGRIQGALAFAESGARFSPERVHTRAVRKETAWVLTGEKVSVLNASRADVLLVTAQTAEANTPSLFVVEAGAPGLQLQSFTTVNDRAAAQLTLNDTPAELLGNNPDNADVFHEVLAESTLALCADVCGGMETLVKSTVEYTRTRKQFGVPIAAFQVLQHRMVDMFIEQEQARSLLLMAAIRMRDGTLTEKRQAASALKAQVGKAARFVAQQAVQLHGGMGMTDELAIGHFFKHMTMAEQLFGNRDYHLQEYARLSA